MFENAQFISQCRDAVRCENSIKAVRSIMQDAVDDPEGIVDALGTPQKGGIETLYHGDDLTILNIVWAPQMSVPPHNHLMWAVIGIYQGAEDNIFWRKVGDRLEAAGADALRTGDVTTLGVDIVHSVNNPTNTYTGALHVYGGDFFNIVRSDWEPQNLTIRDFDINRTRRNFDAANARWNNSK